MTPEKAGRHVHHICGVPNCSTCKACSDCLSREARLDEREAELRRVREAANAMRDAIDDFYIFTHAAEFRLMGSKEARVKMLHELSDALAAKAKAYRAALAEGGDDGAR